MMSRFVRAAGLSVAALSLAAGVAFAGPSLAGESDATPVLTSYTDHGTAQSLLTPTVVDSIDTAATQEATADDSAPIVQHAVATTVDSSTSAGDDVTASDQPDTSKSLNAMVNDYASGEVPDDETNCLATAVYFESKGEPLRGQLAVAQVIINRTKSGRFPATLCGVVKQRGQFSFVRGGRLPTVPHGSADWRKAVAISYIATHDLGEKAAPRALFFHAKRVSPGWKMTRVAAVGNHVFYR